MYKRIAPEVHFGYRFGNKGVYPIRGILRTVGISQNGEKWFSVLRVKKSSQRVSGMKLEGFFYIEETFRLSNVTEGKEQLLPYFEGLTEEK
jgi:hypothetical protein